MMNQLFLDRLEKIKKTIQFENDSVTNCFQGTATPANHMGLTLAEYMSSQEKVIDTTLLYFKEIEKETSFDCTNMVNVGYQNMLLASLWLSRVKMPGRELPDNTLWQVHESVTMKEEDYDLLINKGYDAFFQKILPQVVDMGEFMEWHKYNAEFGQRDMQRYVDAGYPSVSLSAIAPPFEVLCGARSMSQFFMDCYRMPEKVKAASDVVISATLENFKNTIKMFKPLGAWVGGWRGASAMVSPKIWDNLVWPYMYETAMCMIENNVVPIFHLDQNWDRDIERFLELPAKRFVINFDGMTDLASARKKLGDHAAFMGDVPPQLLATGTTDKVRDYCKKLIDNVGFKGLFLTPGCDAPANAKFENIVEMFKTGNDYK